ncbi:TPA: DUF3800 domain-containing protein [Legionella pneumophila]|nr:DUF3800 domain-containing protein [Legionella pneumophila]HAT9646579.1 DUF3800 domain-containing protein [Legionella pneumophila subsp. pneumophila]HAU1452082.1 DUF3800 domain-containing protein [Legionella pneumophila]HAU1471077.1 DUF3800 domain-containing protein [Legionella pneumophila]
MQLFFIDESGTIPPKNKSTEVECFALGGVIIPEDLWHEVDKELAMLKNRYEVDGEIKWRYFSPPKNNSKKHNPIAHLSSEKKEELRGNLYNLLKKYKSIRSICAVVNIKQAYELDYVNNENDLYWFAYKQMTERFQYYLQDLSRTVGSKINGIIVCDHRQPKDDHHLRHLHQKLMTGSKKHFSLYRNLIEGVFIAPSHLSVGIQFADLIGGAVFRKFARQDERYFKMIESLFRKSSTGKIDGYGLIKWPKES